MSKIVNLKKARKSRARDAARNTADANAVKFGRTKAEKTTADAMAAREARDLDGHKRE
ncbi:MAG: DUF4169 family protein [Pseudomonadota bacterium]